MDNQVFLALLERLRNRSQEGATVEFKSNLRDPSEIGQLAVWLASPIAHNITGASIPIDGGWTAQ